MLPPPPPQTQKMIFYIAFPILTETPERFHLGSSGYGRGNGGPVGRNIFPDDLDMSGIGPSGYEAPNIQLDDEDSDDDHYMYERGAYGITFS